MDLALVVVAFSFGFVASQARLPALVGYLVAGFVLHGVGFESTAAIGTMSELGVYLLLFGIGLKLKIGFLARPEVWGAATLEVAVFTALVAGAMLAVGLVGFPMVLDIDMGQAALLGFAFSFSSTVFAVKILEETNESGSLAGRVAVGVLIVQDMFAVAFLAFVGGELPTMWALPMILGLKPELGALAAGIVVSSHPRAGEMADRLLDFKDLFLVGFFLSIGLGGTPPLGSYAVVALMLALIPLKGALFLLLFTRFRMRTRTALHSSLTLSTYSEFGLIVATAGEANGYLDQVWVSAIAVAVASSFVLAAAANTARYRMYGVLSDHLARLERHPPLPDDAIVDCGSASVIIFGMGRVGAGAYDEITARRGAVAVGVDRSGEVIKSQAGHGRNVVRGDALDRDFWERLRFREDLELILVAMDNHPSNLLCVERAKEFLPEVRIAAIARYPDQVLELRYAGVDVARNLYEEAGQGLADDAVATIWEPHRETRASDDADPGDPAGASQEP